MTAIERLLQIMARLRDPQHGCPWDLQQTFETIVPHTLEEAYEVAAAIEQGDLSELRGELGDLLFQVVFYAQLAKEQGAFDFEAVVEAICAKMVRRHPHVFGDHRPSYADELHEAWERHKADERSAQDGQPQSALDGISEALPATTRAAKLQRRAARVGFDWKDVAPALAKIEEELDEVREELGAGADSGRLKAELGDLLFACVNLTRHLGVDPEQALRGTNERFRSRFVHMETLVREQGRVMEELSLAELDVLWERAKAQERADERLADHERRG